MPDIKSSTVTDDVAHNFKDLMRDHEVDQVVLARLSGVSQKTVSNIVAARSACRVDILAALAESLGSKAWRLAMPRTSLVLECGHTSDELPALVARSTEHLVRAAEESHGKKRPFFLVIQ